jgi:fumarylacetoacetase
MTNITLDTTHDAGRQSWVQQANQGDTDFPIQNLPFGWAQDADGQGSGVVAIGDSALDLGRAHSAGLLPELDGTRLDDDVRLASLLAHPGSELTALRHRLVDLLARDSPSEVALRQAEAVRPLGELVLSTPTRIGAFTDFFAGIFHARAGSAIMIPGGDIAPNYRWVPVAYQSRATTVRPSGTPVRRPAGQLPRPDGQPVHAPSERLDFELELGFFVASDTTAETPVPIAEASDRIAGFCLLNDWSARDIQRWEMAPLGPFLSKSFATTISPWVVTQDALRPFRVPAMTRGDDEPQPLPYLDDAGDRSTGGLGIELAVYIETEQMRSAGASRQLLLRSDARHLYWTPAQMIAHHTSNGCDLRAGDLIGTGTISGPRPEQLGSMVELTQDGRQPITLQDGEERGFLEDGDEITFTARCVRDGFATIGFGECAGRVAPAAGMPSTD